MRRAKKDPTPRGGKLRCAVYTRKSSEEGLEQDFNSLDAQREACLAYIASQRHEGWAALHEMYDDGGFSGGTMERPALKRLLAEVAAGKIDVVVVYKVDRLTRSLADFAKIVEILDAREVSFVSVTQSFNTTTSMGRLTLNVLLSFAQFEREVTGERIRDKIAASKKKGMWMGGHAPLGYEVQDRRLVVNDAEAGTVGRIFGRYRDLRSVRQLKAELDAAGIVSKRRIGRGGQRYGGQPFSRGALYAIISNRIYRGEIVHKGQSYPGEHPAIVEESLWDEVQDILANNRTERDTYPEGECNLLTGIFFDAVGERLTPTHSVKNGTRYRYYVSRPILAGTAQEGTGQRIPAASIEALVVAKLRELLGAPTSILQPLAIDIGRQKALMASAAERAAYLPQVDQATLRALLQAIVGRVQVHDDRIELTVMPDRLVGWLDGVSQPASHSSSEPATLSIPARLKRVGVETRFVVEGEQEGTPNPALVRLLIQAHRMRDRIVANHELTVDELAQQESVSRSYATRLIRIAFLAPDIVTSILAGRQPIELTARALMSDTRLPLCWSEQRRALGFAA